jgi:hypothetical protein
VGTLSGEHSQRSVLIDQRCRPMIIISKCVSTHGVCGCRPTLPSALAYTRTHTLSRFLSLHVFVLFPFDIKTHLPQMLIIIEIQDSVVFGCSHFIGRTNTKLILLGLKHFIDWTFHRPDVSLTRYFIDQMLHNLGRLRPYPQMLD